MIPKHASIFCLSEMSPSFRHELYGTNKVVTSRRSAMLLEEKVTLFFCCVLCLPTFCSHEFPSCCLLALYFRVFQVGVVDSGGMLSGGTGERRDEGNLHVRGHGVHLQGTQRTVLVGAQQRRVRLLFLCTFQLFERILSGTESTLSWKLCTLHGSVCAPPAARPLTRATLNYMYLLPPTKQNGYSLFPLQCNMSWPRDYCTRLRFQISGNYPRLSYTSGLCPGINALITRLGYPTYNRPHQVGAVLMEHGYTNHSQSHQSARPVLHANRNPISEQTAACPRRSAGL